MNILETTIKDPTFNYDPIFELRVDGKEVLSVGHMEPEDATINRDLSFLFSIKSLMRQAYEAGKRGEDFAVETVTRQRTEDD